MQLKLRCLRNTRLPPTALFALALGLAGCSGNMGPPDAGAPCQTFFCDPVDPGSSGPGNTFLVTISGEASATEGVAFPPATGQGLVFRDGWELKYSHVLLTVDRLMISDDPDRSPTDQGQTGPAVARLEGGPYAVDLARPGPIDAKEMNGKALRLGRIERQNLKGGEPFSTSTKFAFGYELVAAQSGVVNVNLDAEAQTLYRAMASAGVSVLLKGTATWKGTQSSPACRSTVAAYDWGRVPRKVNFTLGWKTPVAFKNCLNPELTPANSRGVQTQVNTPTVVQVTFHIDHPFWTALEEDAPLGFDAIAARKSVVAGAAPAEVDLTEADLSGADFQAWKDAQMTPLPMRFCGPPLPGEPTTGTLSYDPKGVPVNPAGGAAGLKDFYDYTAFNLSTFGHLNNDGLCYPARNYPSP